MSKNRHHPEEVRWTIWQMGEQILGTDQCLSSLLQKGRRPA